MNDFNQQQQVAQQETSANPPTPMKSYLAMKAEAAAILAEAEKVRQAEVAGVIQKIRQMAAEFGLGAEEIFGGGRKNYAKSSKNKSPSEAVYAHPDGRTWSGRGRRPDWINAAMATPEGTDVYKINKS